jgi:hypothetical protein
MVGATLRMIFGWYDVGVYTWNWNWQKARRNLFSLWTLPSWYWSKASIASANTSVGPSIKWSPVFDGKCLSKSGASCPKVKMCACEWNRVIVGKSFFHLTTNISRGTDFFKKIVVYQNGNVSMHHIPSCIMSSCIMLYHQHKSYVLCKEG